VDSKEGPAADARVLPQAVAILKSRAIHGAFTSPNLI